MNSILTPEQAKAARRETDLSQGKVARDLAINRTYLSLFEGGKYLFNHSALSSLRNYYEEHGYDFTGARHNVECNSQHQSTHHNVAKVECGFHIPSNIDEVEVEKLLTEYASNRDRITEICRLYPKDFLFWVDDEDLEERKNEILLLMSKNYALIEKTHGHFTTLLGTEDSFTKKRRTIGDYIADLFS